MLELGFWGLLGWCFWKLVPALFIASTLWSLGIGFIMLIICALAKSFYPFD